MSDKTFLEIVEMVEKLPPQASFHQKFTCSRCGARQTMELGNVLFKEGECEECKHITNLIENGCGLMVIFSPGR